MGINSSLMADDSGDANPIEPLPSLLELDKQVRDSGRLNKQLAGDYEGRPAVSDVVLPKRKPEIETESFGPSKPYAP